MAVWDEGGGLLSALRQAFRDCDDSGTCRVVLRALDPDASPTASFEPSPSLNMGKFSPPDDESFRSTTQSSHVKKVSSSSFAMSPAYIGVKPTRWGTKRSGHGGTDSRPGTPAQQQQHQKQQNGKQHDLGSSQMESNNSGDEDVPKLKHPFSKQPIPPVETPKVSGLSALRQSTSNNPYNAYGRFAGDGQTRVSRLRVYLPFSRGFPLDVQVASGTTVRDTIGYIMCKYMEDPQRQPRLDADVDAYCLRMAELDGAPDTDLPPIEPEQLISKFQFDSYALCPVDGPGRSSSVEDEFAVPRFVQVYYSDAGCTILKREKNVLTVGDILDQTLRKRCLRFGPEYLLERRSEPGVALDPATRLATLDRTNDGPTLEFLLIRKHSKRRGPQMEDEDMYTDAVVNSLSMFETKAYFVNKLGTFSSSSVELLVQADQIIVSKTTKGAIFSPKQKPPTRYQIDDVVNCTRVHDRREPTFSLVVFEGGDDFRTNDFSAKSEEEADEVVDKINSLLRSRISERRNHVVQRYEQRLLAARKR